MSQSIALATIFLANALLCASACKTNIYETATAGKCQWVSNGAAPADGLLLTLGTMSEIKDDDKGVKATGSGVAMYHCKSVPKDFAIPVEALFYASAASAPQSFSAGSKAPSDGLICDASKCSSASITAGMTPTAGGMWIPDKGAVDVKKGTAFAESGYFCQGCVLAATGATASTAGTLWANGHSAGIAKAAGATNSGSTAMFCPIGSGSSGKTGSTNSSFAASLSTIALLAVIFVAASS